MVGTPDIWQAFTPSNIVPSYQTFVAKPMYDSAVPRDLPVMIILRNFASPLRGCKRILQTFRPPAIITSRLEMQRHHLLPSAQSLRDC